LVEMGHQIATPSFDVGEQYRSTYAHGSDEQALARDSYSNRLVQDIVQANKMQPLDVIITYYDSYQITSEAICEIKQIGAPVVNFSCNNIHQFQDVVQIAPYFHYCIVPEREAVKKYSAAGANPIHIQMAANPTFYRPYQVRPKYDASFVGQKYLTRPGYIHHIRSNGIDARVWGPGWRPLTPLWESGSWRRAARHLLGRLILRHQQWLAWNDKRKHELHAIPPSVCGGTLSDRQMVKLHSRSKISLNFSEVEDQLTGEIKRHIRLRDFEGPMCGAFFMTGYQEELADYYEIDKEIVCYDTKEELVDKVKYYLAHPVERDRIRIAGLKRAKRDHTWPRRFEILFKALGLYS
jgi:spore maturation protein CgeB